MKLYRNYIFVNLFKPLLVSTFIITGVIWLTRSIRFLKYITEDGVRLSVFLQLSLYVLPSLLLIVIPLSVFLTAIITYNKLIENREIVILQGTGVRKVSIIFPAILVSFIAAVFCYFITLYFMPFANRGIRKIREDIKNNYSSIMLEENAFNKLRNITVYVRDKDEDGNLQGVLIYDNKMYNDSGSKEHILIYAKRGRTKTNILELFEGNLQKFDNVNTVIPDVLFFDSYYIDLSEYDAKKIKFVLKLSDMYIGELFSLYKKGGTDLFSKEQVLGEINYRFTFPLFSIIMTLIGSSCILYGGFNRVGKKNRNIINSTVAVVVFFLIAMYLYKVAETTVVANYILYFVMFLSVVMSMVLIKDAKYGEIEN